MLLTILISVAVLAAIIYVKLKKTSKVEESVSSFEEEQNSPKITNFVMVEEDPIVVTEQPVEPSIKKKPTPAKKATQTAKKSTSKKAKKQ
jgi:hypothetical protein